MRGAIDVCYIKDIYMYIMIYIKENKTSLFTAWDRRGRESMVVGFTTTYAFSAYHH